MSAPTAEERNRFLTPAMEKFLSAIRDSEDEYAIQDRLRVMVDLHNFSAATVSRCLRLCLISEDSYSSEGTHIYTLNEEGRAILADSSYVPQIVQHYRAEAEALLGRKP